MIAGIEITIGLFSAGVIVGAALGISICICIAFLVVISGYRKRKIKTLTTENTEK